jgi:hypothetical protein
VLGTKIRFSSGLEAQYIVAEAQGLNADNLAFINARRAVGNMAALDIATTTEAQFQAALRDQRRRDFFLSGHRLGDLRRYITQYNLDLFPSGYAPERGLGPVRHVDVLRAPQQRARRQPGLPVAARSCQTRRPGTRRAFCVSGPTA